MLFYQRPPDDLVARPDPAALCRAVPDPHHGPRGAGALSQSTATGCLVRDGRWGAIHALLAILHPVSVDAAGGQSPAALDPCGLSGGAGADHGVGEIGLQQTQRLGTGHLGSAGALQCRTGDGPDRGSRWGAAGVVGRLPGEDSGWERAGGTGASPGRNARPGGRAVAGQSAGSVRSGLGRHYRPGAQRGCLYPGTGLAAGGAGAGSTGRTVDRGPQLLHPGVAVGPARAWGGGAGARARKCRSRRWRRCGWSERSRAGGCPNNGG